MVKMVFNKWPGLYAKQFNWALDYVERVGVGSGSGTADRSSWILRLDADEYLTPETCEKLKSILAPTTTKSPAALPLQLSTPTNLPPEVAGLTLELKRRFCGCEIRHATNGIRLLRIWRAGHGRTRRRRKKPIRLI